MNFHQTPEYATYLRSIGWKIETHGTSTQQIYAFIRILPLLSVSLLKLQRVTVDQIDWDWVYALEKRYHAYETVIELDYCDLVPPPLNPMLLSRGYATATDFMLTTKTRVIDLNQPENSLLAAMKPKTRYNIHVAKKHDLKTTLWTMRELVADESLFQNYYNLLSQNAKRIKMLLLPQQWIHQQFTAFGEQGFMIGITQQHSPALLNAAAFFTSGNTCSYSHNGSTATGRTFMAPTLTIWEGIREGKRRGLSLFDFDGVYDERFPKQKRFQGFGRFKAGFGGNELYFPPMYRKYRLPFLG